MLYVLASRPQDSDTANWQMADTLRRQSGQPETVDREDIELPILEHTTALSDGCDGFGTAALAAQTLVVVQGSTMLECM